MAAAMTILSDANMQVSVQLDELDVAAVKSGQKATVQLSALEDQSFEGTVTSRNSSDGSYYAIVSFPRAEGMFSGFSATVTIVKEEASSVIIIPLDAVQQRGSELFVYTEAAEDGTLSGELTITTGLSDESRVEVTSGLNEGDTVYYQQQITSSAASTGSTNSFGQGGQMPSFSMSGNVFSTGPGQGSGMRPGGDRG
jgi:multidrug efflux pump subunit AcrA (membrane-fusion protein)